MSSPEDVTEKDLDDALQQAKEKKQEQRAMRNDEATWRRIVLRDLHPEREDLQKALPVLLAGSPPDLETRTPRQKCRTKTSRST